jgi:DNA primase
MSERPRLDFIAIKDAAPILKVAQLLQLKLRNEQKSSRCDCPIRPKNDRTLAITPGYRNKDGTSGAFYCESCRENGDAISLYAHIKQCSNYDAALALAEHFGITNSPQPPQKAAGERLKPLDHLNTIHPAIELLGLTAEVCEALGIGFAPKGLMAGRIAFPLRLPDGELVGYAGLATKAEQSPLLKFPDNLAEKVGVGGIVEEVPEVKSQDELRRLLRVV